MCKDSKKYTIKQFREEYPDENACLDKVFKLVYRGLSNCPKCDKAVTFRRVATRRCYQCPKCYHQLYPCRSTIFEKSTTPLTYWFYTIFLFTVSKNGISAMEVMRQVGVTYKTAWRMLKQVRTLFADRETVFTGIVQVDETFVGGLNKNRHWDKKVEKSQGRSFKDKTPVFGAVQANTYKIITTISGKEKKVIDVASKVQCFVIPDTKGKSIRPIIRRIVKPGSIIVSDEWHAYTGLSKQYDHRIVDHARKEYVNANGDTSNAAENLWSCVKRTIKGSYIHVSPKYLQSYVNECSFRFNNRTNKGIFNELLTLISSPVCSLMPSL